MLLSRPRCAQEDDVLALGEEVELVQMGDALALEGAAEGEVEVVEGFDRGEPRSLHPGFSAVELARRHLLGEHRGQIAQVVPALFGAAPGHGLGHLGQAGRLEGPGVEGDVGCGAHRPHPAAAS